MGQKQNNQKKKTKTKTKQDKKRKEKHSLKNYHQEYINICDTWLSRYLSSARSFGMLCSLVSVSVVFSYLHSVI